MIKLVLMIALTVLSTLSCNFSNSQTGKNEGGSNSNASSSADRNGAGPTATPNDQAAILFELIDTEKRWKTAKFNGDLGTLDNIFADEFTNAADNGKTYTKAEWIALWKRGDPTVKSWEISDERLESTQENKATITFTITLNYKNSKMFRSRDTDTFIKRDGRWQVITSQSSKMP